MSTPIKIQINSLEALERLLGGSTDMEIELRQAIAVEFTKKHLKPLATSDAVQLIATELREQVGAIRDEVRKKISTLLAEEIATIQRDCWGRVDSVNLKPEVKAQIQSLVRSSTYDIIREQVDLLRPEFMEIAEKQAGKSVDYHFKELVKLEVSKRVKEALKGMD